MYCGEGSDVSEGGDFPVWLVGVLQQMIPKVGGVFALVGILPVDRAILRKEELLMLGEFVALVL